MQIKKKLFSYYSWLTYYLFYYFGNIAYPIIYPIISFTYRKVKFSFLNNYSTYSSFEDLLASTNFHKGEKKWTKVATLYGQITHAVIAWWKMQLPMGYFRLHLLQ